MTIPQDDLRIIKMEVREDDVPFFEEKDLEYFYNKNRGNLNDTIHELLLIKAQDSTLQVSGLSTTDTSNYFKMLASKFRRFNSGTLR